MRVVHIVPKQPDGIDVRHYRHLLWPTYNALHDEG
jgi:hypothetical protein